MSMDDELRASQARAYGRGGGLDAREEASEGGRA